MVNSISSQNMLIFKSHSHIKNFIACNLYYVNTCNYNLKVIAKMKILFSNFSLKMNLLQVVFDIFQIIVVFTLCG